MTTLNITFKNDDTTPRFPVYHKYGGQFQPQPAYIFLDLRDGECGADYNGEMGSVPVVQWHNIVLTFPISAETKADQIEQIINDNAEKFQAILDDSEVVWDGSNNVGSFGEKTTALLSELGFYADGNPEGLQSYDSQVCMIDEEYFAEWVSDISLQNYDLDSLAEDLHNCDGDGNAYFTDSMNSKNAIYTQLLDIWAERLYSGYDVPKEVAQTLLDEGKCDESAWVEELKEFANS